MKQICRHCHFLVKNYREANDGRTLKFALRERERLLIAEDPDDVAEHYSLNCHMGVWDEGLGPLQEGRIESIMRTNRKGKCFFFPYNTSMMFEAAKTLQARQAENENLKRSNLYTRIGLWIAAGALAISAAIQFVGII